MQQIADWLKTLGLSEYAERFAESDIDISVLRDLTDQDLKELGVSLGHRRKMLRAIAELAGVPLASPQPVFAEPKAQDTAERRQVTVMFSDLVGSTALSARMDPEELARGHFGLSEMRRRDCSSLRRFVAKYLGDGALVYFGYPQGHEDDAVKWSRWRHRNETWWKSDGHSDQALALAKQNGDRRYSTRLAVFRRRTRLSALICSYLATRAWCSAWMTSTSSGSRSS
jgi:class 3 adenylate cyclase